MVQITDFESLLAAAKQQPEPQEFLFVFLKAFLPDDATPEQTKQFEAGQGGNLMPVIQVNKALDELSDFASLREESKMYTEEWQLVLIGCLSGQNGERATQETIDIQLESMANRVKDGQNLSAYLAFNAQGEPIQW